MQALEEEMNGWQDGICRWKRNSTGSIHYPLIQARCFVAQVRKQLRTRGDVKVTSDRADFALAVDRRIW